MKAVSSRAAVCCALCFATVVAQAAVEYSSRSWQMEDGLPHTVVQAVKQTRDGYLWVGTREGLARFDGVRFLPLKLTGHTPFPSISALCEAQDGSLWIGTTSQGLFHLQGETLGHYGRAEGLPSNAVTALQADHAGGVWIGSQEGVARWQEGGFKIRRELGNQVWGLFVDEEETLWLATSGGLRSLRNHSAAAIVTTDPFIRNSARSAYRRGAGALWVGSVSGLSRWQAGAVTNYPKGSGPTAIVSAVFEDREGTLWVGTYGGLNRFVNGQFIPEGKVDTTSCSVYTIGEDREGNVWVGSEEGLTRYVPNQFTTYTRRQGLTHDRTVSVLGGADGSIWIGTWGGGVNRLKDGHITAYTTTDGLANDLVYSLHEGRDGSLWIGLDMWYGLDRLKEGQFTHFGRSQGLTDSAVTVIQEDSLGELWVGTRGGLYRLNEEKLVRYDTKDGLTDTKINAICPSQKGGLWIGTESGITRSLNRQFEALMIDGATFHDIVFSLYEDAEGVLWIGTKGEGLKRLEGGRLSAYTTREGLINDVIYGILEDARKNLWLSSSKGIFRVRKAELDQVASGRAKRLTPVCYGKTDGIYSSTQFTDAIQPAASKDTQGRLWFRTTHGVTVTDPERIIRNELAPPVWIEEVVADNRPIESAAQPLKTCQDEPAARSSLGPGPLKMPPGRGDLEIRYTALSFRAPEKNQFKYRLQGVDMDWVDAGARRFAHYGNIAPGHYLFEVIACNNDGVWNETGASVSLAWQPHYWQTLWFRALFGLVAVGAVGAVARYMIRKRLRRKIEQYEQQQALARERARIARDIHDDLGARLTQITLLSELSNAEQRGELGTNARKIALASREMAESLDEIVWAVNPAHDTLAGVIEYLSQSADAFLEETSIRLRLNTPKETPPCKISAQVRHQLFLAFREALNNAVKHAGASEIQIDVAVTQARLQVTITDNGTGFEPRLNETSRNGLRNMRHRLETIGGSFDLTTQPGLGTRVQLAVDLNPHKCADRN
jgi:ligand-binding sensor domain-containing protein/signal transduction histidine kinase